ncbi:DUF5995 family protein [Flavitalea flava]
MAATTIDDLLLQLEKIISDSQQKNDRAGYFAALYYKVTSRVKEGITKNEFGNGAQMERLDVLFANRYLDALEKWRSGGELTDSWKLAFNATKKSSALILQQLLLGINAHINLDLGIAAVETMGDLPIGDIEKDFDSINIILGSLTYEVINDINRMSPLISLLGLHSGNTESILIQFSISNARDGAWCFAEDLSKKTGADKTAFIRERDKSIAKLASTLINFKGFIRLTIGLIHLFEWKNAGKIIRQLHEYKKTYIKVSP